MASPAPTTWTLPHLAIDRDGAWRYEGGEVTHLGILANLRDNLRADAAGYYLEVGSIRVPVEVEDTPYLVLRVERDGDRLTATLNDLTREPLEVPTLSFGADSAPYCRVKGGRFAARLTRAAAYQLFQFVECDEADGAAVLVVGRARSLLPGPGAHPSSPAPRSA